MNSNISQLSENAKNWKQASNLSSQSENLNSNFPQMSLQLYSEILLKLLKHNVKISSEKVQEVIEMK